MIISFIVVAMLFVLIVIGVPVYISLGFSALFGFLIVGGISNIVTLPAVMYGQIDSFVLLAIPLYVLMGEVVASSGLASGLFECLGKWLGKIPGGLSVATIFACCAFGAVCGSSVAGVAAFAPVTVPEMLKRGYDRCLAIGSLTAAGALAVLIPPSIAFIVYGSISLTSVSKLFIAGIIPGIFLACMMAAYVVGRVILFPGSAPAIALNITWTERFQSLKTVIPVLLLAIFIFGSLYTGICTPTELGALAAIGAIVLGRIGNKSFGFNAIRKVLMHTARSTITIGMIIASALCFGTFLNVMRVPEQFSKFCLSLSLPAIGVVILFMFIIIILGCFIDSISLIVITTPIFLPVVLAMNFDPIWYGVILVVNYEIATITPPVGMNLYMMKSVIPELRFEDIVIGAYPFVIVEIIVLLILVFLPAMSLWLPNLVH